MYATGYITKDDLYEAIAGQNLICEEPDFHAVVKALQDHLPTQDDWVQAHLIEILADEIDPTQVAEVGLNAEELLRLAIASHCEHEDAHLLDAVYSFWTEAAA